MRHATALHRTPDLERQVQLNPLRAGPARAREAHAAPFSETERQWLLGLPGIGPVVLHRLEEVGYGSIDAIRRDGVARVVAAVVASGGTNAWRNRIGALERAMTLLNEQESTAPWHPTLYASR